MSHFPSCVCTLGRHGTFLATVPEIVAREARPGDVVAVLSNGGFGGIRPKLLDSLRPGRPQ